MRVSPINHPINFGYNKRLTKAANEKLSRAERTPIIRTLDTLHQYCVDVEDEIIRLERPDQGGTYRNEEQINTLYHCLLEPKRLVCMYMERFFPELNFRKKTIDTLDEEETKRSGLYDSIPEDDLDKKAYKWREELFQALITDLDATEELVGNNNIFSGVGVGLEVGGDNNLLVKYTPSSSSSPKSLDDIIGLKEEKENIEDLILFPLEYPEEAKQRELDWGIKIPSFVLLYGPPGCGKTMTAQALATQSGCDMYSISLSSVGSSFVNGTVLKISKAFKEIFKVAQNSKKPVIIFMDEMDSVASKRGGSEGNNREDDKVVNTLLTLIEEAKDKNVIIIGATNMYDKLDAAIKRRARHESYIGLPDKDEIALLLRRELSKISKGLNLAKDNQAIERISQMLYGYSPCDIGKIIEYAQRLGYRKGRDELVEQDFEDTLKRGSWAKIDESKYLPENKKPKNTVGFTYS